jgi:hypothetical protein
MIADISASQTILSIAIVLNRARGWRFNMKLLGLMVSTLLILAGAKALAASQTCQDADLKRQVAHYASNLTRGYYAKWNEIRCASAPESGALVFSIRHVVKEYYDKNGNLYMTIAHVDRIPVDQIGNIDSNREAQWGQYEDGPVDQGQ